MKMDEYIGKIESWMDQVRDDDLGVDDYDFLDEAAHKGRDGNNGLAQLGAHLAIYREDGEIKIDYDLIEELESRQADLPQGGRNRFSNIVYEGSTDKRDGKTLRDKMEEGATVGHERLETMLEEAEENIDNLSEVEAPETNYPDGRNQRVNKSGVTISSIQGENDTMPDDLDRHADYVDNVLTQVENDMIGKETAVRNLHNYMTNEVGYGQVREFAERYEELVDDVVDLLDGVEDRVDDHQSDMTAIGSDIDTEISNLESYVDFMSNELDDAERRMDTADSRLDR